MKLYGITEINVEEFCFNQKEHGLHSYYELVLIIRRMFDHTPKFV